MGYYSLSSLNQQRRKRRKEKRMEDEEHEVNGGEIPDEDAYTNTDVDMTRADDDAVKLQVLDELKKLLKEMEEEAAALREMQAKVEKEMGSGQDPASAAANQENKHEVDSRSVFVGNLSPKEMEMATGSKRKVRRDDEGLKALLAKHYHYYELLLEDTMTTGHVVKTSIEFEEEDDEEEDEDPTLVYLKNRADYFDLVAGSEEEEDDESDSWLTVEELEKEDDHEIDEPLKGDNNDDAVEDDKNVEIDAVEDYKDDDEVDAGRKRVRVSGPSVGKSDKEGCDNSKKKAKVGREDNSAETQTAVQ